MAWNGRNVSILGAKTGATDATPSKQVVEGASSKNNQASSSPSEQPKKPTAPPARSVWNGRHAKIIAETSVPTVVGNVPSTTAPDISKKDQLVKVVSSSPKEDAKNAAAKEDETATNSTSGSASTITSVSNEASGDPPAPLEGNTVVTTTLTKDASTSLEDKATSSITPASLRNSATSNNNNNSSNRQHAKNATSDANANSRRSGNYKGGQGRTNNNQSHPGKQNYSRSNPTSGSAAVRKRVYKHSGAPRRNSPPAAANMNFAATTFVPSNKRVFDPHKAMAIKAAKEAQDHEDRTKFVSTAKRIPEEDAAEEGKAEVSPLFSIDVECIATGYGSCANGINDGCGNAGSTGKDVPSSQYNERSHRYPGRVAMVDSEGKVLADITIRPPNDGAGVTSYLTPLTGLTAELCFGTDAKSLEEASDTIKRLLPQNGILVGQAIDHDVEWLGLTPGVDFERMVDISEIFRQRMPAGLREAADVLKKKEEGICGDEQQPTSDDKSSDAHLGFPTYYRHFSLRHVSLNLLSVDIQSGVHNPITDAQYSLLLFHKYRDSSVTQLRIVRDGLHRAPITPGFAQENGPVIDSVCLTRAGYRYKRAGRSILRWYQTVKKRC